MHAYNHKISVLHQAKGNVMNRLTHSDVPVAFILYISLVLRRMNLSASLFDLRIASANRIALTLYF
jgi:hypothetical protein